MNDKTKFNLWFLFLSAWVCVAGVSAEPLQQLNFLRDVSVVKSEEALTFRLEFKNPLKKNPTPVFYKKSVQMDFPEVYIHPSKRTIVTKDSLISEVYVVQQNPQMLRTRFVVGEGERDLRNNFRIERKGNILLVRVEKNSKDVLDKLLARAAGSKKNSESPRKTAKPAETKPLDTVALLDSLQNPVSSGAGFSEDSAADDDEAEETKPNSRTVSAPADRTPSAVQAAASVETENGTEGAGKTPGFLNYAEPVAPEAPSLMASGWKMFYTLAIVLGLMFLLFYVFKKVVLKNSLLGGNDKVVKVLGTGFLGPKKMIALVEVAGEVLALGISNDNISLLAKIRDEEKLEKIRNSGQVSPLEKLLKRSKEEGDTAPEAGQAKAKTKTADGSFMKYIKQFSDSEPAPSSSLADVKDLLRKTRGKIRTAS